MKKQKDPTFLEECWKAWKKLDQGEKMVVAGGVIVVLLWLSAHPEILQAMIVAWSAMHGGASSCSC